MADSRISDESSRLTGDFWMLWRGETFSTVGSQITTFAVPLIAVLTLHASATEMGIINASGSLAILLLSLPLGAWADRSDHLRMMMGSGLARAAVVAVLPLALWAAHLSIALICLVTFTNAVLGIVYSSSFDALVPELVSDEKLERANALIETNDAAGEVVGPGAAGLLTQLLSPAAALVVDAASYVVAAGFVGSVSRRRPRPPSGHATNGSGGLMTAAATGLAALRAHRGIWALTLAAAIFNLFTAAFFAVFLVYEVRSLELRPIQVGVVATFAGAGGVIGSLVAPAVPRIFGAYRSLLVVFAAPSLTALGCVLAGRVPDTWVTTITLGVLQLIWVVSIVVNLVICRSYTQRNAPRDLRGRFSSSIRLVSWGVEPLGALAAAACTAVGVPVRTVLIGAAVAMTFSVVPVLVRHNDIKRGVHDLVV